MKLFNTKRKINRQIAKRIFCFFFLIILILSFFNVNELYKQNPPSNIDPTSDIKSTFDISPELATDISMLEDPFTQNLNLLKQFFENKYKSDLDFSIDLYFRYGDSGGVIIDDTIFSEDNLLIYKSLMGTELSPYQTYEKYLNLKSTPLWYVGTYDQFKYGFVRSFDNTTGMVKNDNRYLIDNLMPIFLLIENIGIDINSIDINGNKPIDSIVELFNLVNSSEFWDDNNIGFNYRNSTTNIKYTEFNLYGILANLQIHRILREIEEERGQPIEEEIKNRSYDLANQTMENLILKMWDPSSFKGFYYNATESWVTGALGTQDKYLHVNALGIITLLELWTETGMQNDSTYLQNAVDLFVKLENLWSPGNAYMYKAQRNWASPVIQYNLDANSIMMSACLKLFELTGNITFYHRALDIFDYFENVLYDTLNKSYRSSNIDPSKNLHSNLLLSESYLNALEIYNSTIVRSVYNVSDEIPDFIFNQEVMNLTSSYSFEKSNLYYNPGSDSFVPFTISCNLTNADIHYLIKYPNGTFLNQFEYQILSPNTSHTFLYNIQETLPIGNGYSIYVWANTTYLNINYFKMAWVLTRFNVYSGLINKTINGLGSILYQGPIVNVTVPINNTRNNNVTLSVTLEGDQIKSYPAQIIEFISLEETPVSFNLTTKAGAIPGNTEIYFKFMQGSILYLEIKKIIEIGFSFAYDGFLYDSKIVGGDKISVSMNLINFSPNASQSLNVSFSGEYIDDIIKEEILDINQRKTVSYELNSSDSIIDNTIEIEMSISINKTNYYTKTISIEILPKFEIISVSFPGKVTQGSPAYFILIIRNNREKSEDFSLFLNNKKISTNLKVLGPGENRILKKITPTNNPYEFGSKSYIFLLKDSSGENIAQFYFEITIELSTFNLIIFYLLPIIAAIGLILYFKNKDLKIKKLRR
ncbi:MAG: hypothetical protein ACFE9T_03935 [Promethearchaeota archaeon]